MKNLLKPAVSKNGYLGKTGVQEQCASSFSMKYTKEIAFDENLEKWEKKTQSMLQEKPFQDDKSSTNTHSTMTHEAAKLGSDKKSIQSSPTQAPEPNEIEKRKTVLGLPRKNLKKREVIDIKTFMKQMGGQVSASSPLCTEVLHPGPPRKSTSAVQEEKPEPSSLKKIPNPSTKQTRQLIDILKSKKKPESPVSGPKKAQVPHMILERQEMETLLLRKNPDPHFEITCGRRQKSCERPAKTDKLSLNYKMDDSIHGIISQNKSSDCAGLIQTPLGAKDLSSKKSGRIALALGMPSRKPAPGPAGNFKPLPEIVEEITDHGNCPNDVCNEEDFKIFKAITSAKPAIQRYQFGSGLLSKGPKPSFLNNQKKKEPGNSQSFVHNMASLDKKPQPKPTYFMSYSKILNTESSPHLLHLTNSYHDYAKNHAEILKSQKSISLEGKRVDFPLSNPPKKLMLLLDLDETLIHCDPLGETKRAANLYREVTIRSYRGVEKVAAM